jgi:hypothetical protein
MAAASIAFAWMTITTLSVFALSALGRTTMVSDPENEVLSLAFERERARVRALLSDTRTRTGR